MELILSDYYTINIVDLWMYSIEGKKCIEWFSIVR